MCHSKSSEYSTLTPQKHIHTHTTTHMPIPEHLKGSDALQSQQDVNPWFGPGFGFHFFRHFHPNNPSAPFPLGLVCAEEELTRLWETHLLPSHSRWGISSSTQTLKASPGCGLGDSTLTCASSCHGLKNDQGSSLFALRTWDALRLT